MSRLWIRAALRMYPRVWRTRYGAEFEALLEQTRGGWSEAADAALGGLKMRFTDWRACAALAMLGLVAGGLYWSLQRPHFVASVEIPDDGLILERVPLRLNRMSVTDLVTRHNLYPGLRRREPMEAVIDRFRSRDLAIRRASPGSAVVLFHHEDPGVARRVAAEIRVLLAGSAGEPSVTPLRPTHWLPAVSLGLCAGLLAGLFRMRRARLVIAWSALFAALTYAGSWAWPDTYHSSAWIRDFHGDAEGLAAEVIRETGLPGEQVRRSLRVGRAHSIVELAFRHTEPRIAQRAVESMTRMVDPKDVIDPASFPHAPVSPNREVLAAFGLAAGALLGFRRSRPLP